MNGIIIFIIVLILIVITVFSYKKTAYSELANIYPTKECEYKNYYYLWVNMTDHDTRLSDPQYNQWCTDILLSGPNCIGIYVPENVSNNVLAEYIQIYKDAFGFDPAYIRGYLNTDNRDWCSRNGLKVKTSKYKLHYC